MFSIGWPEFFVVLVVAILVIGPKDLPKALYTVGRYVKSARKMGREFQRHVDDMMRDAELDDVAKTVKEVGSLNPKTRITQELTKAIDPTGSLKDSLDPTTGLRRGEAMPGKPASKQKPVAKPEEKPSADTGSEAADGLEEGTEAAPPGASEAAQPQTSTETPELAPVRDGASRKAPVGVGETRATTPEVATSETDGKPPRKSAAVTGA